MSHFSGLVVLTVLTDACATYDDKVNNCSCDNVSFSSIGSKHSVSQWHADNVFVQTCLLRVHK